MFLRLLDQEFSQRRLALLIASNSLKVWPQKKKKIRTGLEVTSIQKDPEELLKGEEVSCLM